MEPIQYINGPKVPPKSKGTQVEPQDWPGEITEEPHQQYKIIMGKVTMGKQNNQRRLEDLRLPKEELLLQEVPDQLEELLV